MEKRQRDYIQEEEKYKIEEERENIGNQLIYPRGSFTREEKCTYMAGMFFCIFLDYKIVEKIMGNCWGCKYTGWGIVTSRIPL